MNVPEHIYAGSIEPGYSYVFQIPLTMPFSVQSQRIRVTFDLRMDSNEQTIGEEISFIVMASENDVAV